MQKRPTLESPLIFPHSLEIVIIGSAVSDWKDGAPGEIRTPDPLVRSQMLYPAELRAQ